MTDEQKAKLRAFRNDHAVPSTQAALSALFDHAIETHPGPITITWEMRDRNGNLTDTKVTRHPDPKAVLHKAHEKVGLKRRWDFTNAMVAPNPKRT